MWSLARVQGVSMSPTLRAGDMLVLRRTTLAEPGAMVVVDLPGDRPRAVKRLVRREPAGWWVERDNPAAGVDSWAVGAVPADGLHAIVVARLWPRPRVFRPGSAGDRHHRQR